jgi:predicted phosphodiesterase
MIRIRVFIIIQLLLFTSCILEPEEHASLDLSVGRGSVAGADIIVTEGLGAIQRLEAGSIELWLQSPALSVTMDLTGSTQSAWEIRLTNAVSGMVLTNPGSVISYTESQSGTDYTLSGDLTTGTASLLNFSTPGGETPGSLTFACLSDIQEAVDEVHEIYNVINADPEIRFVLSGGDLTETGSKSELDRFRNRLSLLNVPFYTTMGNHETFRGNYRYWRKIFGRASFSFLYRGVRIVAADSSGAGIEPPVYRWIEDWLGSPGSGLELFLTHYPLIDPDGIRNGGFKSRNEAYKLIAILLDHDTDMIISGHIHSYYHFNTAGIDSYISGGGGAIPEQYDGVGRHYLKVTADGGSGIYSVERVEVD